MSDAFENDELLTPPDAVAVWQRLAERFTDVDSKRPRGAVRVGVIDTLSTCDALPFWYRIFVELGFSVVMPPHRPAGLNDLSARGRETVPSESVCYPAKMSHIRAAAVVDKGANAVFMPLYDRYARCSVSCEYANAVGKCMPQLVGEPGRVWRGPLPQDLPAGQAVFVSPLLLLRKPWKMIDYPSEVFQLLVCLNALLPREQEISVDEIALAMMAAAQAQQDFQRAVDAENERALAWAHEPGHHGVLLVGRPYHWDRSLLHDLNTIATKEGLSVMTSHPDLDKHKKPAAAQAGGRGGEQPGGKDARGDERVEGWGPSFSEEVEAELIARTANDRARRALAPDATPRAALDIEPMPNVGDRAQAVPFWRSAKHMGRLCRAVAGDPDLDVVCLQSFGCGYDAASVPEAREIMREAGKPFTLLMIDDSVNTAHLVVRIRTLAAAIRQRKAAARRTLDVANNADGEQAAFDHAQAHAMRADGTEIKPWERHFATQNKMIDTASVTARLCAVPLGEDVVQAALMGSVDAFSHLGAADYEASRLSCENYCFIVAMLTGRVLRICAQIPRRLARLLVPYVCDKCLLDALPRTVERTLGWAPTVIWERNAPVDMAIFSNMQPSKHRPLVGIVGAPPLVFDASLNDNLVRTIIDEGCQPVLPWLDLMLADDVSYLEQLDEFAAQGVSHVVYLISFGCLKGHTQVRPRLAELRERYPHMGITVIDFDGDASSLNRRNRLYLALAMAKEETRVK